MMPKYHGRISEQLISTKSSSMSVEDEMVKRMPEYRM